MHYALSFASSRSLTLLGGFDREEGLRGCGKRGLRNTEIVDTRRLAAAPSEPAPGRHTAIEAQIGDEIAVVQGVMISDLR